MSPLSPATVSALPARPALPACTQAAGALLLLLAALPAAAAPCATLTGLELRETTIRSAVVVPAGAFTPPGTNSALTIPSICRVVGVTRPAVSFEVWLPLDGWNGKFHVSGNGGMAGVISYGAMAGALRRGYAAASTDTGHVRPGTGGFDASWALGRPDLVEDFGHRALHVTADNGKAITAAFYERPPRYSYYVGCSKGGQQGLMEAQRYPDDFDGIVAGNPANDWTRFYAGAHLWYALATLRDAGSYIPRAKLPALAGAVNAACDTLDGVEDGVLDDPRRCRFDPAALTCPDGEDHDGCLTPPQVLAVRAIRAGSRDSAGDVIFPGLVPGGENGPGGGWGSWVTGREPFTSLHWLAAEGFFKYMVFEDPDWNFRTFDYDADLAFALDRWARRSTARIPTSAGSGTAARSFSSTTAGAIRTSRRSARSTTTRTCWPRRAAPTGPILARVTGYSRMSGRSSVFSWCPAWGTARAARATTAWIRCRRSSGGWRTAYRRSRSRPPAWRTARSSAADRSAPTRPPRHGTGTGIRTTRRASGA